MDSNIKLISNDNVVLSVPKQFTSLSSYLTSILDSDPNLDEINLTYVNGEVLEIIVGYFKQHMGIEPGEISKPLVSPRLEDSCPNQWDVDFINSVDENLIRDLINSANYMGITSLLKLACAKVASMIKGKPLDKMKEILLKL